MGRAVPRGSIGPVRGYGPYGYGGRYYPYYGGRYYPYYNGGHYYPYYPYYRYRYYWPGYGYSGLGLGWSWYNPYWYDGYWGYDNSGYASQYTVQPSEVSGGLRLEIEPETAEVYVDGSYAGIVDDFNGHSHYLNLTAGAHHIEVRASGYQTLTFDTMIQADHTISYKGHLVPIG